MTESFVDIAKQARSDGEPTEAGDQFTLAAYEMLSHDLPWERPHDLYRAERYLTEAALCYRFADDSVQSENRSQQGQHIGAGVMSRLDGIFEPPRIHLIQGAISEYLGDLQTVANHGSPAESYDAAERYYEQAGTFALVDTEELNDYAIGFFDDLVSNTGADFEKVDPLADDISHDEGVRYKRERLPDLVKLAVRLGVGIYSERE